MVGLAWGSANPAALAGWSGSSQHKTALVSFYPTARWFLISKPKENSLIHPTPLSPFRRQACTDINEKAVGDGPAGTEPSLPMAPSCSVAYLIAKVAKP